MEKQHKKTELKRNQVHRLKTNKKSQIKTLAMKNSLIVTAILFLGSFAIKAQDVVPADNPNAAGMKFEFEEYDFGNVNEGDDASVDFVFTNDGKEKLILTDVKASCGCTTPFWSKEPVMPGEKGKITAKYNT